MVFIVCAIFRAKLRKKSDKCKIKMKKLKKSANLYVIVTGYMKVVVGVTETVVDCVTF